MTSASAVGPHAVVFDKDGTLLDFAATWNPAFKELLHGATTAADASEPDPERLAGMAAAVGYDLENAVTLPHSPLVAESNETIAELLLPWAVDAEAMRRGYFAAIETTAKSMTAMANALEVLDALRARGIRLAVATNDSAKGAERMIEAFGWHRRFDSVVGSRSGYGVKPEPGMVLGALGELGVAPANAIMIGDSTHDIDAGRAAGTTTVIIGDAACDNAHHRIAELRELLTIADATFDLAPVTE